MNLPRFAAMAGVLLLSLLFGTVVFAPLGLGGWRPDLVTLTVVGFALADGPGTGARYGFAAGLGVDLVSGTGQVVGLTALVLLFVGYSSGTVRPYLTGAARFGQVAVAAVATAAAVLTYGLLALLLDVEPFTPVAILQGAVVVGVMNGLLAPFVCGPIRSLSQRLALLT